MSASCYAHPPAVITGQQSGPCLCGAVVKARTRLLPSEQCSTPTAAMLSWSCPHKRPCRRPLRPPGPTVHAPHRRHDVLELAVAQVRDDLGVGAHHGRAQPAGRGGRHGASRGGRHGARWRTGAQSSAASRLGVACCCTERASAAAEAKGSMALEGSTGLDGGLQWATSHVLRADPESESESAFAERVSLSREAESSREADSLSKSTL